MQLGSIEAKKEYEKEQWKKEQAKLRGEDTWMLPALNDRLEREQKEFSKKSKKAKKEKKKKKKHKKEKKKKKSESESSSEDSDDKPVWVEKGGSVAKPSTSGSSENVEKGVIRGPQLQRDSWMESPMNLIPTVSKKDILEQKRKEKEKENADKPNLLDTPGQHERELNPYWKDGGTGLPEMIQKSSTSVGIGDGGLSWMKKAYQRCEEQAKEEGRTLDVVATEKYGSLKKLEKMLSDAEMSSKKVIKQQDEGRNDRHSEKKFRRPNDDDDNSQRQYISSRRERSLSRERYRKLSRSRSREGRRIGSKDRYRRSRSKERMKRSQSPNDRRFKRPSRSRSRSPVRRQDYRSRSPYQSSSRRDRSRSPKYYNRRRSRSPTSKQNVNSNKSSFSSRFKKPDSDNEETADKKSENSKNRFARPGGSDDEIEKRNDRRYRYSSKKSDIPAWKKKEFVNVDKYRDDKVQERKRKEPTPPSTSSSSSSSSESSEEEESEEDTPKSPPVKLLTEQEMNQLGAKIVRAELMGDMDLAAKLKAELDQARELKERNVTVAPSGDRKEGQGDEDNVVVLTRTDKQGRIIPLPEMSTDGKPSGKRRRKKQKVDTHGGIGERKQYFDDDDKFDLKSLVEREKMGTAEDDSKMFARLAQRSIDKTDDDYQIDDVFLDRAAKKQSISISEMKERSQAIYDHKKMAGALEKCHFCFGNVPKHLIIAIGTKSYLSLPNYKSLTEGHCLIVPMHHSPSCTAIDEDVWEEMQTFRKTLVKMFLEEDEDIVFMETSMRLKQHPHMYIECVPLPKETGDMAPIYFKKAIQEAEYEWSDNKKLVDLRGRNIRKAIPKGFPYFCVDFGNEGGFAHVIEDERSFPYYFGREILGGMLDAEPQLWRKPSKENFDDQRKKVLQFAEKWKPYDWTQKLCKDDDDS
ncbi:CWF19-like protein 2 homolog,CWF19-like protein 2 [Mytilus coruscus]|uniref:CWF19-like protein 2 homolog,CWF19-like protein 2 n=1 Tax=Mytilus coruscus TaxID=42192 RepID=A0A6J8CPG4_MYTCO|nr:CWF19-like protein 2 homolog,CWF19-like protein 2 [Mytilus coruscus]